MAKVTTSVTVQFSTDAEDASIFTAEVDGRDTGLNNGRTNFQPGDNVYLLLYQSSDVTLDAAVTSKGALAAQATVTHEVIDYLTFANETSATLSKPVTTLTSSTWLGVNLGMLSLNAVNTRMSIPTPSDPNWVGVAKIVYTTTATPYLLSDTSISGETDYEIATLFVGHTGVV